MIIDPFSKDLTDYRKYSRQIFQHVRSIVWDGNVERLGLDELFCDVTSMIVRHLDDLSGGEQQQLSTVSSSTDDGKVFFNLNKDRVSSQDTSCGFFYPMDTCHGFTLPTSVDENTASSSSSSANVNIDSRDKSRRLQVASHLAAFIRDSIEQHLGFGTSAGIAHTKQLSKLAAGLNKPAKQTVWFPLVSRWESEQALFLGPFKIESLMGFGSHVVKTLRARLLGPSSGKCPHQTSLKMHVN
jgi:DNA polymerase iota